MTLELLALSCAAILALMVYLRSRFAGFVAQTPQDYQGHGPVFDLKQHLNGQMTCEGVIFGPLGRVTSSFVADFDITWRGNNGVMREHFHYNDGSEQTRQWQITLAPDGAFRLEAADVPGQGQGVQAGGAVQMRYPIRLPEGSGGHVLQAVDWMYLTADGSIINRSQFRKFGIKVAELVATIRPRATAQRKAA